MGCGPSDADPCGEAEACDTDADSDSDADADTDTDTDADSDTDTDSDTDSDTDTDTEEPFVLSCDTTVVPTEPCLVAADGSGLYTTIQEAVDAASEGDIITVCPGYYDSVVIDRVGLTLQGYGADSTCIIGSAAPGIRIEGSSSASPVDVEISGFTVSGVGDGATATAGAIYAQFASGQIHDVRIAGVEAGSSGTREAVGIGTSDLTWDRVTFEHNRVDYALFINHTNNIIRHSVFRANVTGIGSWAAAEGTWLEVTNCIFTGNSLYGLRGGQDAGLVANNVFYENGIALQWADGPINLLLRNNVALSNATSFSGAPYDMDYNVEWDNLPTSGQGGAHDVTVDPRFEDAASGDFRLKADSPLIDAGDPDPAYDDADGSRNDIGAFGGPHGEWSPG